ncbi:hypothetical protein ZWY2020_042743 [Hordeum vulgare]|nr:hypothetical protein ZWY2020_042743 [Hordeum vulgare]
MSGKQGDLALAAGAAAVPIWGLMIVFLLVRFGRDEERSYQAHIAGSYHFASGSFAARMPELVRAWQQETPSSSTARSARCEVRPVLGCFRIIYPSQRKIQGIKNIMVLERGYNGWEISGQPSATAKMLLAKAHALDLLSYHLDPALLSF